jgi:hypothetical protein
VRVELDADGGSAKDVPLLQIVCLEPAAQGEEAMSGRHTYKLVGPPNVGARVVSIKNDYLWVGDSIQCFGHLSNKRTLRAIGKRLVAITQPSTARTT